jgi:shikimate dehydrogenase
LVLANRTLSKAAELAADFAAAGHLVVRSFADLADIAERFDIVVNGTSASQRAELPPAPANVFTGAQLAYDMVYGKGLTPFLKMARAAGVPRVADGVGMLVEQAAEAFAWWRGVRPHTADLIAQMTIPLT